MGTAENQGQLWNKEPRDWAMLQEPLHTPLWNEMLDKAQVRPGTRFLDAGCGGGGASMLASERGAKVSGLDAAAGLIAVARERLPEGDFQVAEIQALPYEDESFDSVFASNSVQYSEDRIATLRELGRVCTAQGLIVASLFGPPETLTFRDIFKAVRETMPEPPSNGGPFELSAPGVLEGMFEEAGLKVIESNEVDCPFSYPDFETFWKAFSSAGNVQGVLKVVSEEMLIANLKKAIKPFSNSNGKIHFQPNIFKYVVASR